MMTERFSPQQPLPVVNLSVTGFAVTAPLIGEPLAGRRVFGVWRFAPFGSAGVMFASAAEVGLGADRRKDQKSAPITQRSNGGALPYYNGFRLLSLGGFGSLCLLSLCGGLCRSGRSGSGLRSLLHHGLGGIRIVLQREEDDVLGALLGAHAAALALVVIHTGHAVHNVDGIKLTGALAHAAGNAGSGARPVMATAPLS